MYNSDLPTRADLPTVGQLTRSTAIAAGAAGILLVTVVLPAEYAVDPTGIGAVLGLQEMGLIKQQLQQEAELDAASVPGNLADGASAMAPVAGAKLDPEGPASSDSFVVTLAPGQGAEVKVSLKRGARVSYEWTVDQGHLNSDLHGNGLAGEARSYRKGRAESSDQGDLIAEFEGDHGWFWRNRSEVPATITLRLRGQYSGLKRVS